MEIIEKQMQMIAAAGLNNPESVDTIIVQAACYDPPKWQALIRHRDKTKAGFVGIAATPLEALLVAMTRMAAAQAATPRPRVRKRTR